MTKIGGIRRKTVRERNVGHALRNVRAAFGEISGVSGVLLQQLDALESDYQRMCDFMLRGFRDDQRDEVYGQLLRRTVEFLGDCELAELQRSNATFGDLAKKTADFSGDHDSVRRLLEGDVQNLAMLSLESDETTADRLKSFHEEHLKHLDLLFNTLLLSKQWTSGEKAFYTELLLSPTIDGSDAALLVSAVMLSAMTVTDVAKWKVLFEVCRRAADEQVRQRALVGVAFALPEESYGEVFPEFRAAIEVLCGDERMRRELLELQKQVFLCMDADRDHETIQRDIMPTIMKNQKLRFTSSGIEEIQDDPLQDILNPNADDEAMEELEQSIRRMMDMQRGGADIYFGGFSQMKRFTFFYTMSNWFMPFSVEHPALQHVVGKLRDSRFLQLLFDRGPFCDSDKYSFALAMSSVLDRLPENMRELLNNEDALGPTMPDEEQRSAAYIRRMYLQDLYRFFRLFPQRSDFRSPFDYEKAPEYFFFTNSVFSQTALAEEALSLERFLLKRKHYNSLMRLIHNYEHADRTEQLLIEASFLLRNGNPQEAQAIFARVLEKEPDNDRAIHGMARASFNCGDYAKAIQHYDALLTQHPENQQFELNACISRIHYGQTEEAVQRLYKLYYELPEDKNVSRALAWGLLMQGSLEQAERIYGALLTGDGNIPTDFLNAGYCQWFNNHVEQAVGLFRRYRESKGDTPQRSLLDDFKSDAELLTANGIGRIEMMVMADLVSGF
ncbi:MAG: tetratricopeptide repeat protein [Prevotella sp.]|nr:tetratricopeptide repeat protein [Prevotella sp.]